MLERMFGVVSKRATTRLSGTELSAAVRCKKQRQEVELLNICSRGLRFKSFDNFEVGEKLWFDIWSNEEKPLLSLSIKGKIINTYEGSENDKHEYGVRFFRFRFMNEAERIHYYVHTHVKVHRHVDLL